MDTKRKRCSNFNEEEKKLLLSIAEGYFSVIENKRTDATTTASKIKCWQEISETFNARSGGPWRTYTNLKMLYENLKRRIKRLNAEVKTEVFKIGEGGSPSKKIDEQTARFIGLLRNQVKPRHNRFDSAAELLEDNQIQGATATTEDVSKIPELLNEAVECHNTRVGTTELSIPCCSASVLGAGSATSRSDAGRRPRHLKPSRVDQENLYKNKQMQENNLHKKEFEKEFWEVKKQHLITAELRAVELHALELQKKKLEVKLTKVEIRNKLLLRKVRMRSLYRRMKLLS